MIEATRRFISHIGFDDSPFNIEFYWDDGNDQIRLLEVNTRISKSHAPLLRNVDGEYHHQVMLDVAVGRRPDPPHREGRYPISAKFMWRVDDDAVVTRAPEPETIDAMRREFPGTEIELHVREGMRLSELAYQDSYSYEIAAIHLGGRSEADLLESYACCRKALDVGLEPVVMT
jgi:biotin carboxylase